MDIQHLVRRAAIGLRHRVVVLPWCSSCHHLYLRVEVQEHIESACKISNEHKIFTCWYHRSQVDKALRSKIAETSKLRVRLLRHLLCDCSARSHSPQTIYCELHISSSIFDRGFDGVILQVLIEDSIESTNEEISKMNVRSRNKESQYSCSVVREYMYGSCDYFDSIANPCHIHMQMSSLTRR